MTVGRPAMPLAAAAACGAGSWLVLVPYNQVLPDDVRTWGALALLVLALGFVLIGAQRLLHR